MLRQSSRLLVSTPIDPIPSPLWASGFNFTYGSVITEVPYDPQLRHLFFGEEVSMAARLWTSGYDFFAPPETVVFHLWKRDHRPNFREVGDDDDDGGGDGGGGVKRRMRRSAREEQQKWLSAAQRNGCSCLYFPPTQLAII